MTLTAHPRIGSVVADEFRVLALIAKGSVGTVYRAERITSGTPCALKVVHLSRLDDPRAAMRFEREARMGQALTHPNVAKTLASGTSDDGTIGWLAMEYVRGSNLLDYVAGHDPLSAERSHGLLSQIFSGLEHAHQKGIVHRDLKPENILVEGGQGDEGPTVKVVDFGIAKALDTDTLSGTAPGLGTPMWTAPEQGKSGYEAHPRSDVWALGLLTFFVLTGRVYWRNAAPDGSLPELAMELLRYPIVVPSRRAHELRVDAELPVGFDAWFDRCVNRDIEQRFSDAASAWRELAIVLGQATPGQRTVGVDEPSDVDRTARLQSSRGRAGPRSPGWTALALLGLGLTLIGYALYSLLDAKRTPNSGDVPAATSTNRVVEPQRGDHGRVSIRLASQPRATGHHPRRTVCESS